MRLTPPRPAELGPDETLDQLIGDWWVHQLRGGHRFSTDDLMVAWRAATLSPGARRLLDLGCGIGSVGLYALGMMEPSDATLTGVEAQEMSVGLVRRSVTYNGLNERVQIVHGDIRDPGVLPQGATFDLVTGSPPYLPVGKSVLSPHPQRAACRNEMRGSVIDYCQAAVRWMAPGCRFSFVMLAHDPRIQQGLAEAGLVVVEWFDVIFREGRPPLVAVVTAMRAEDAVGVEARRDAIVIRDRDGKMSEEYSALRRGFGFSVT